METYIYADILQKTSDWLTVVLSTAARILRETAWTVKHLPVPRKGLRPANYLRIRYISLSYVSILTKEAQLRVTMAQTNEYLRIFQIEISTV